MDRVAQLRRSEEVLPRGVAPAKIGSLAVGTESRFKVVVHRRFSGKPTLAEIAAGSSSPTITQLKCQLALAIRRIKELEAELAKRKSEEIRK